MIYIDKIKVIKREHPSNVLPLNFEIECSDINIIVGEQGTGKSTLLKMLQSSHKDLEITLTPETIKNGIDTYSFDTEKDNPRNNNLENYTTPNGKSKGIGIGNFILSHIRSHGEVIRDIMLEPLKEAKDCIIFLDEPESGLSISNQYKLKNILINAVKNGCQVFVATHCYILIEAFNVISFDNFKKIEGKKYLKSKS